MRDPSAPPPRVYLIDGSSYIFRAFHAIPSLATSHGLPTNAIYGFLTMLLKFLREEEPQCAAVVLDAGRDTFRVALYSDYKRNRPDLPDTLRPQLPHVRRVVAALGLPLLEEPGVEADDVIATLATRCSESGLETVVVTGDKDLMQIVGPSVTLYDTMRTRRTGPADVEARLGVPPALVADLLALTGDATDNVPGVPGIGEKTAALLLRRFGSLEELLAQLDALPGSGLRRAAQLRSRLATAEQQVRLAKQLVTVRRDLALAVPLERLSRERVDVPALRDLCREFEFHSLLRELGSVDRAESLAPPEVATDGEARAAAAAAAAAGECALALGQPGVHPLWGDPEGVAVAWGDGEVVWVPWESPARRVLFEELATSRVPVVTDDAKRLFLVLGPEAQMGGPVFDVGLAAYIADPDTPPDNIEELANRYVGAPPAALEAPTAAGAAAATALTARVLAGPIRERLRDQGTLGVFWDVEMPLAEVLARMERRGVRLDTARLGVLAQEVEAKLGALLGEIFSLAGGEFNVHSPAQLREVLFDRLGLSPRGLKKGKTGFSTDATVLARLARLHPLPGKILEHRMLAKLKSTYIDALPPLVHPRTGRIHASFHQTVTATGRLSTRDPNLQNIPVRTAEGRRIRAAFVPREGWRLVTADYSQIELRLLAHLAEDPTLAEAFRVGQDVHTRTAAEVFGVPPGLVTADMRRRAKVINFGIIYGMGSSRLARELGISVAEAERYIAGYFDRYPGVRGFIEKTLADARARGYVTTLLQRRRFLPTLNSRDPVQRQFAERTAINTPIQGSAADLIKRAMVELERTLHRRAAGARMIMQIHDELLFEAPPEAVEETRCLAREVMEGVVPLRVPLRVEVRDGEDWAACSAGGGGGATGPTVPEYAGSEGV